jgi:hypothetical protein
MTANYPPPAPVRPPPAPPPLRSPRDSAGYIPWWMLAIVAAGFGVASLALLALVLVTRPAELPQATASAVVITAAPATTADVATATLQSPPTAAPEAGSPTPPPPPPGVVGVGAYVQVVGTGDAGFLNLRAEPNIESPVNYLAIENEVFQVQAGPTNANGFDWWYLVDPATNTRFGWAVQNYLQVVQAP